MSLRFRLLLAAASILAVVVLGAFTIVRTQHRFLVDQVDDQLVAARPLVGFPPAAAGAPPPQDAEGPAASISMLYLAYVDDRGLHEVLRGELLEDTPAIEPNDVLARADADPFTTGGSTTRTAFRVATVQPSGGQATWVIALPLDEVNAVMARLRWSLFGATLAIATVLVFAIWWVERLGLRPVARLTAAADAIALGDRAHRVTDTDTHTEAGRLANAFNVMLDERDSTEERLRHFVADASHELRTPLTSIRGYLDLYREGGFGDRTQVDDMVRRLSQESSRMSDLVEDLFLLAELDQHRPLRTEPVDVGDVLRDAASDAGVLQPSRPVVVRIVGPEPVSLVGDRYRLQQVVGTLVSNALAYTDVDAELRLTAAANSDLVEITVADNGPGLSPDDAARVFDRFYRGERSRARRTGGSGLGLAIAKSIVEAHRGTITLQTAPGSGCRFRITIPRREAVSS